MEEVVWESSSSMIPLITSPSWGSGFVSSQLPVSVTLPAGLSPNNVQSSPDHSLNIGKFFQGNIDGEELDVGNGSKQSSNPVESNDSKAFTESNRASLMVGQLLPKIGCITGLRFSQYEDSMKFVAGSALAMSGSGTNWRRALSTELSASATMDTVNAPEDQMDPNLGSRDHAYNNEDDTIISCLPGGNSSACNGLSFAYDFENLTAGGSPADYPTLGTESIQSLDCLLSITNSNAHTAMQADDDDDDDGGISAQRMEIGDMQKSMILSTSMASERRSMILNTKSVSSAGSSESPETAMLHRNRAAQAPVDLAFGHDREESVSQGSSHPRQSKALFLDAGCSSKTKKRRFRDKSEFPTAHKRIVKDIITDKKQLYAQRSLHFGRVDSCREADAEAIACMREMIYRAAAFRPINLGMEVLERPKRKNVRISSDPQTVAARQRRERISDRIRILQRLVPGGTKMDTASMLDEAVNYLKFLKAQVKALQSHENKQLPLNPSHHLESPPTSSCAPWFPVLSAPTNYSHPCNSFSFPVDPRLTSAHGH